VGERGGSGVAGDSAAARRWAAAEGGGVGATRDGAADKWAGMRRGPIINGWVQGQARQRDAAPTRGPVAQCARFSNRINFILNGFKFAPNFDRSKRCLSLL
jgi:hypothetical protein